jgi:hypothetical protein
MFCLEQGLSSLNLVIRFIWIMLLTQLYNGSTTLCTRVERAAVPAVPQVARIRMGAERVVNRIQ